MSTACRLRSASPGPNACVVAPNVGHGTHCCTGAEVDDDMFSGLGSREWLGCCERCGGHEAWVAVRRKDRGGITGRLGALGKTKEGTKSAAALGLWCLPACPLPSCRRAFIAPAAKRGSGTRDCPRARRPRGSAVVTTVDERAVWVHRPRKHSVVLAPSVIKPFRYSHTLLGTSASTLGFCATPEYA